MDEKNAEQMMKVNGGQKVIPTILIDGKVFTGYDKAKLKQVLSIN